MDAPPSKRRKLTDATTDIRDDIENPEDQTLSPCASISASLDRPISPPPSRRAKSKTVEPPTLRVEDRSHKGSLRACRFLPSPVQLTRIKDLAPAQNVDTVGLADILGDAMVKQCWNFNYLFDIDFVIQHFDPDVRNLVKLKIVHGFWRRGDERRDSLHEAAERYPNIELIGAYMPDPFGTHHSKIIILIRHDGQAQVVIHTANMISRDWRNMTQAVWRSPLLPIQSAATESVKDACPIGSGERFKADLLRYLHAYGKRLTELTSQLVQYDFSAIRAAFIGSTPSRQSLAAAKPSSQTSWGWLGLREILSSIPIRTKTLEEQAGNQDHSKTAAPNIVIQISSIATLGQTPAWLTHFQSVLSSHSSANPYPKSQSTSTSFFTSHRDAKLQKKLVLNPKFNIIFPTPTEIRTSLDGYNSGASVHTKIQSPAQQKQLQYLHPLLCHWVHSGTEPPEPAPGQATPRRKAERGPAAPHIKTYIQFHDEKKEVMDWAMVTSANLSKQAWGEVENKKGEVWIQSWECGVVVWPALFSSSPEEDVDMMPVFGRDLPRVEDLHGVDGEQEQGKTVVGFRMPYDLPLSLYKDGEVPWCASVAHDEPDRKGQVWQGYRPHA